MPLEYFPSIIHHLAEESFGLPGAIERDPHSHEIIGALSPRALIEKLNAEVPIFDDNDVKRDNRWGYPLLAEYLDRRGIKLALLDFDMTLGWTKDFYINAEYKALELCFEMLKRPFNYTMRDAKLTHHRCIHESVDGLIPAHARASGLIPEREEEMTREDHAALAQLRKAFDFIMVRFDEEVQTFPGIFNTPYRNLLAVRPKEEIVVERVRGGTRLLLTLQAAGLETRITTNSRRDRIESFFKFMGYDSLLAPDDAVCSDDPILMEFGENGKPLKKSDKRYRELLVSGEIMPRSSQNQCKPLTINDVTTFEDNPTAAGWSLDANEACLVMCRDERLINQNFDDLKARYPDRLFIVNDWQELGEKRTIIRLYEETNIPLPQSLLK